MSRGKPQKMKLKAGKVAETKGGQAAVAFEGDHDKWNFLPFANAEKK